MSQYAVKRMKVVYALKRMPSEYARKRIGEAFETDPRVAIWLQLFENP
jgi:hypothetical protein